MLFNRKFGTSEIKDVSTDKQPIDVNDVSYLVETTARCTANVILVYVGADILRRVAVYVISAKI